MLKPVDIAYLATGNWLLPVLIDGKPPDGPPMRILSRNDARLAGLPVPDQDCTFVLTALESPDGDMKPYVYDRDDSYNLLCDRDGHMISSEQPILPPQLLGCAFDLLFAGYLEPRFPAPADADAGLHRCTHCHRAFRKENLLSEIRSPEHRLSPGDPWPSGECPACGALCHPADADWERRPHFDRRSAVCDECRRAFPFDRLKRPKDLLRHLAPGEPVPAGRCPECAALCHAKPVAAEPPRAAARQARRPKRRKPTA